MAKMVLTSGLLGRFHLSQILLTPTVLLVEIMIQLVMIARKKMVKIQVIKVAKDQRERVIEKQIKKEMIRMMEKRRRMPHQRRKEKKRRKMQRRSQTV